MKGRVARPRRASVRRSPGWDRLLGVMLTPGGRTRCPTQFRTSPPTLARLPPSRRSHLGAPPCSARYRRHTATRVPVCASSASVSLEEPLKSPNFTRSEVFVPMAKP